VSNPLWIPGIRPLLLPGLLLATAACASGGAGGNNQSPAFVRMDVGIATAADLAAEGQDLIRRQQFRTFRTEAAPAPLIQTEWRNQTPTEDERAQGITEVQCRILVRGRERAPQGRTRMYSVTYTMEGRFKTAEAPDWIELPFTPQRTRMATEIGRELTTLLEFARR